MGAIRERLTTHRLPPLQIGSQQSMRSYRSTAWSCRRAPCRRDRSPIRGTTCTSGRTRPWTISARALQGSVGDGHGGDTCTGREPENIHTIVSLPQCWRYEFFCEVSEYISFRILFFSQFFVHRLPALYYALSINRIEHTCGITVKCLFAVEIK